MQNLIFNKDVIVEILKKSDNPIITKNSDKVSAKDASWKYQILYTMHKFFKKEKIMSVNKMF